MEPSEFAMPFGKYRDDTLEEIYEKDEAYLWWGVAKWDGQVGRMVAAFLEDYDE